MTRAVGSESHGNGEQIDSYLEESMSSIDISEMLYELIMLSIPMRRVHPNDEAGNSTCDKTILKYLSEGTDDNSDDQESTKNLLVRYI